MSTFIVLKMRPYKQNNAYILVYCRIRKNFDFPILISNSQVGNIKDYAIMLQRYREQKI